ncbi:FtsX-like permease family protein [Cellulosimicrobium sp. CUA-896]|uniref:FtsX-like permease family protein n=1 Tax=Cellulosimicrobium sp. CUA-896 TaxID=1517881 RepID=UPI001301901A|nr:FtsX-like permease family protein [Cellulosimicrobium sp. CUA-896]
MGALVLALAGVLAVATALLRVRRPEVAVLRALGVAPGAQARGRALELAAVTGASLVLGTLAGWAVATLTVPALARATLGDAAQVLPVPLGLAAAPTALLLGVLLAGLVAVAAVVAARVRAQALDGEYREEIR